jgi:hypothetical protein
MSAKLKKGDCITEIVFAGHGSPGSWSAGKKTNTGYEISILKKSELVAGGAKTKIFEEIKEWWCETNSGVELQMCNQAEFAGKDFMKKLAETIGADVTGWEGTFELWGTGDKYTATPSGEISKTGHGIKGPATALSDVLDFTANMWTTSREMGFWPNNNPLPPLRR